MNEHDLKHIIEATLLAAGKPVTTQQLLELFDERERPALELMQTALGMLKVDYETRGIELIEVASGWRIQVRPRTAEVVSRLWTERPAKYSRALLETLALIAYRQPITRSEIEEIRGVSISSTIMRTLQERNWIRTVGHREVPGRPELLGTTREFLDYFGLKSLDQLPILAELKDLETIGVQLELQTDQPAQEGAEAGEATSDAAASAAGETAASSDGEAGEAGPGGERAEVETQSEEQAVAESETGDGNGNESGDESNDDSELSADADDGDEDSDASPIMVASSEDEEQDRGRIIEPPTEA
ncbi:MAG: SMC-Scp complex subunit ScpB [Pseudomonadota bacterium]|nr:SMC-Scp complex subunit ScpB [Pseudomonadota bacterium]